MLPRWYTVTWYENDGAQSFTAHVINAAATYARSVHVADVDSDGALDVVSASTGDDSLSWYASAALEDENYISRRARRRPSTPPGGARSGSSTVRPGPRT